MLGSLRKVWPWKITLESITDRNGEMIPAVQHNTFPGFMTVGSLNSEVLIAIALAVAGFVIVILLERLAGSTDKRL